MRILLTIKVTLALLVSLPIIARANSTDANIAFELLSFHAQTSLQANFKSYPPPHHSWLEWKLARQTMQEDPKANLASMTTFAFNGGYDHTWGLLQGRNTLGLELQYARSTITSESKLSTAHSFGLSVFDHFKHESGLFALPSLKYIFATQENSSIPSSQLALAQVALGYRMNFIDLFYLKPMIEVALGYLPSLFDSSFPIFFKAGGYAGIDFWSFLKGDVFLGAFLDSRFLASDQTPSNHRLLLSLGSHLALSDNLKFFLKTQMSFLGKSNLDYSAGFGLRVVWGEDEISKTQSKTNSRTLQQVQKELLYQAQLHRQRVQEKTHLKPEALALRQQLQEKRDSGYVQDEIKFSNRQRAIREGARWINTKPNEENYQNRNGSALRNSDEKAMQSFYKRELERKYGKQKPSPSPKR